MGNENTFLFWRTLPGGGHWGYQVGSTGYRGAHQQLVTDRARPDDEVASFSVGSAPSRVHN
ncbi:hypothetical protein BH23ACT2_BH23ACT2_05970 [soil metagenome]